MKDDAHIINLSHFIEATRDSGYKNTTSAVAELVDNSIQAGAKRVEICIHNGAAIPDYPLEIAVVDDGCGMDAATLRQALRFGGSTRFGDRSGLGRYGMGLPNASLSQARRLEVHSWTNPRYTVWAYLDVDEIAGGHLTEVPRPQRVSLPTLARDRQSESGTIVYWKLCDRLDHRRASTIGRKLKPVLGRVFRHFIWDGVQIVVNGEDVLGIDPLYLHRESPTRGATLYEGPLEYKVRSTAGRGSIGVVTVTFSELPIEEWHSLPNDEKRALGIANGAGVSVIRGGREIDYGWFFMGGKRRENYDDWWRCEVKFEPVLDEAFGITHTKQQIRPREHLLEAISPELTEIAKALNSRVRQRHTSLKVSRQSGTMEQKMEEKEKVLPKLPNPMRGSSDKADIASLARVHRALSSNNEHGNSDNIEYRIVEDAIVDGSLFRTLRDKNRVVVVLNTQHAFYRRFYSTLHKVESVSASEVAAQFQAMFLSAARAEALITRRSSKEVIEEFREQWGKALSALVND